MARFGAEDLLLQLGAQLERASPWFNRMPEIANPI
jgi:Asp-tRNA(Asn)/Glu-tRNA(Gln) amidotransferase A subunit family amidase